MKGNDNKTNHIPSYRILWLKIRYYQGIHEVSDENLAKSLGIEVRTLKAYDKNAKNITLEKVEGFLNANKIQLIELITL